eukprot:scaffold9191_cov114-Cylindrotheca_fusiformis.AAC.14
MSCYSYIVAVRHCFHGWDTLFRRASHFASPTIRYCETENISLQGQGHVVAKKISLDYLKEKNVPCPETSPPSMAEAVLHWSISINLQHKSSWYELGAGGECHMLPTSNLSTESAPEDLYLLLSLRKK